MAASYVTYIILLSTLILSTPLIDDKAVFERESQVSTVAGHRIEVSTSNQAQDEVKHETAPEHEKGAEIKAQAGPSNSASLESWKIAVPTAVSLFVLLITNLMTLWKIRLDSKESVRKDLLLQQISKHKGQLERLYDPITALTRTNFEIFHTFGPPSFPTKPEERHRRAEAIQIWNRMTERVILNNNREICTIIKSYSHLLHPDDDFEVYLRFMQHAESYEAFREIPNEQHKAFPYPKDFENSVSSMRQLVLNELYEIEAEFKRKDKKENANGNRRLSGRATSQSLRR